MAAQPRPNPEEDDHHVISPFAQTTSTVQLVKAGRGRSWPLWVVSGMLFCVCLAVGGYFAFKAVNDPYRTLEPFSVDKYLADYQPLAGSKFKADLKVANDLGWKEGTGRLMVFTGEHDSRPVLVLIPPKLAAIYFTKGQTYQVALEVGEGGLIYADFCDKE